jgi:cell wall-associated NlpC family hydrolase
VTNHEFVLLARSWLGVPFAHQGRSQYGVDCIGFPIALLRQEGLLPKEFHDRHNYGRQPTGEMEPIVLNHCRQIQQIKIGCLALIRWPQLKFASHAGIITGGTMIHSYQRAGCVVENGFRGPWVKNLHSLWELPGITYE